MPADGVGCDLGLDHRKVHTAEFEFVGWAPEAGLAAETADDDVAPLAPVRGGVARGGWHGTMVPTEVSAHVAAP
jgi:hypothetical protein